MSEKAKGETSCKEKAFYYKRYNEKRQGSKNVSGHLGRVDFPVGQATFQIHLSNRQRYSWVICQSYHQHRKQKQACTCPRQVKFEFLNVWRASSNWFVFNWALGESRHIQTEQEHLLWKLYIISSSLGNSPVTLGGLSCKRMFLISDEGMAPERRNLLLGAITNTNHSRPVWY